MNIFVNGEEVRAAAVPLAYREPPLDENGNEEFLTIELDDGNQIRYFAGFTDSSIPSTELRGFAIYIHEKTAQAPPFFFDVERTASGQHGTRYVHGEIYADFLDNSISDEEDIVSTDRQEIDWESDETAPLLKWGDKLSRRLLIEWANRKAKAVEERVEHSPELRARVGRLDQASRRQFERVLKDMTTGDASIDELMPLVDNLLRVFEYRHFSDLTDQIDLAASNGPDQLQQLLALLGEWKVLESRAILEIVNGRLKIIEKFRQMIVNDAPETAPTVGADNMHDLLAGYPWLIKPEWQVLAEEKTITQQLREWGEADNLPIDRRRFDFLALTNEDNLVVVEIKRAGHAIELTEINRAQEYAERLRGHTDKTVNVVVISSHYKISPDAMENLKNSPGIVIRQWSELHDTARAFYEHYQAVLDGDVEAASFANKSTEVARTRNILQVGGAYRTREDRRAGLGSQDVSDTLRAKRQNRDQDPPIK